MSTSSLPIGLARAIAAWRAELETSPRPLSPTPTQCELDVLEALDDPEAADRRAILAALDETKNDRERAAQLLGVDRRTLFRRMSSLSLWDAIDEQARAKGHPIGLGNRRSKI